MVDVSGGGCVRWWVCQVVGVSGGGCVRGCGWVCHMVAFSLLRPPSEVRVLEPLLGGWRLVELVCDWYPSWRSLLAERGWLESLRCVAERFPEEGGVCRL